MVKLACAEANYNLKNLDQTKFEAIEYSCNQLIRGNFHDQFPIDMMQGGAGTSTNMNANEVLANVALEYMGHSKVNINTCIQITTLICRSQQMTYTLLQFV